jgi:DNA repair protein SbcC/Rad50
MITAIELRNFKTHEQTLLEFRSGANVIVGVMGSGKSSVMEALSFGLFGTFPGLKNHKVTLSDVVRGFSEESKANTASVRVDFTANGEEYSVSRKISESQSEAYLRKAGALLEGPQPMRVTERIEGLLGMDYDAFVRTAYCEQNRIDHFLNLGKGDRKKQLDGLLGLDRLEKARQSLSTVHNSISLEANAYKKDTLTTAQLEEAEAAVAAIENEVAALKERMAVFERDALGFSGALESKASQYEAARACRERHAALRSEAERISATVSALKAEAGQRQARIDQLRKEGAKDSAIGFEEEKSRSGREIAAVERRLYEATAAQSKAESAKARADKDAAELGSLKARLSEIITKAGAPSIGHVSKILENISAEKNSLMARASQLKAQSDAAKKARDELSKAGAECPVCAKPLDAAEKDTLSSQRHEEIRNYESEAVTCKSQLADCERKERDMKACLDNARLLSARIDSIQKDYEESVATASGEVIAEEIIAEAKAALVAARKANEEIAKAAFLASALSFEQASLSKVLANTAGLEARQVQVADAIDAQESSADYADDNSYTVLELERNDAMRQAYEAKAGLDKANAEMRLKAREAELSKAAVAQAKKRAELAAASERKALKARSLQAALIEVQENLRVKLITAVNEGLDSAWKKLYPYTDYTSARLAPSQDDYALELCTTTGEWVGAERASGGERSIASLALRMAFASVLAPSLDLLILDEPTHNLDARGVSALCEALKNGAGKAARFDQVFVITHEETLAEAGEGTLYEFSRSKDGQDPTVATRVSEIS